MHRTVWSVDEFRNHLSASMCCLHTLCFTVPFLKPKKPFGIPILLPRNPPAFKNCFYPPVGMYLDATLVAAASRAS